MILISHRGNINGRNIEKENHPNYIDTAIKLKYNVEVDVWVINNNIFLGHDIPQYNISLDWLDNRKRDLWIHCKNLESVELFNLTSSFTYFWHENDTVALTSNLILWAYPGKQPIKNSIAVLPEIFKEDVSVCVGVCSDYIQSYHNYKI